MRRLELSPRLAAIAEQVPQGARLADVGTDHAYLPAWLLLAGRISGAVATDVREGPLQRGRETARLYKVEDRIVFRCCDGLAAVEPQEADTVVIAGMGGELILRIVGETPWLRDSSKRLILQPMSSVPQLRSGLVDLGYSIIQEEAVVDGGKVYSAFTAQFSGSPVETGPLYPLMGKLRPGAPQVDRYAQKVLCSLESQRQGALHQGRMDQAASLEAFIRQIQTTYLPSPGGSS